jgi:hypothetical protein
MKMSINDLYLNRGLYFREDFREDYPVTKKLVLYAKNKPKIIEVTIKEEVLNKVKVATRSGKEMWVNKKELF